MGNKFRVVKIKKKPDTWKLSKIPVSQVYKKKVLRIFPSYSIKDFEKTITLDQSNTECRNESIELLSSEFLDGFIKKKHMYVHLGLVQVAIKPLIRDGLGAPIVVYIKDGRHHGFRSSLLAMVQPNLLEGPFYFNCFPSFSVSWADASNELLTLNVSTNGLPLAITYRVVCKAMVDLNSEALEKLTFGKTTYFQGTPRRQYTASTVWDDVLNNAHGLSTTVQDDVPEENALTLCEN